MCFLWIGHPSVVKFKGTLNLTLVTITIGINSRISAMSKLEELVLRLIVRSGVADSGYGKLGILYPIVLGATFAQSATIRTNNSRVSLETIF